MPFSDQPTAIVTLIAATQPAVALYQDGTARRVHAWDASRMGGELIPMVIDGDLLVAAGSVDGYAGLKDGD